MILAAYFKAHLSGGVPGLSGIVFDYFIPIYFLENVKQIFGKSKTFITNHTKTQLDSILKSRPKLPN